MKNSRTVISETFVSVMLRSPYLKESKEILRILQEDYLMNVSAKPFEKKK